MLYDSDPLYSAYCSIIILGLMFSTCSFYHYSPLTSLIPTQSFTAKEALPISLDSTGIFTGASIITNLEDPKGASPKSSSTEKSKEQRQTKAGPSSCWIDLSHKGYSRGEGKSKVDMGRWSAPTWRKYPSVLSRLHQGEGDKNSQQVLESSIWRRFLKDGIFVGFDDVGFRLRFSSE